LKNTDKIDICTYIFAKYKWIENDLEKDVLFENKLSSEFREYERTKNDMRSGPEVEVDETAICHGYLHDCP
jgi:hypothetical protein